MCLLLKINFPPFPKRIIRIISLFLRLLMKLGITLVPSKENCGGMLYKRNWIKWRATKSGENVTKMICLLAEGLLSVSGSLTLKGMAHLGPELSRKDSPKRRDSTTTSSTRLWLMTLHSESG